MSADPTPLDGPALEVVEAYRRATAPPPGVLNDLWTQLQLDIDAGMVPQAGDGGAGHAASEAAASEVASTSAVATGTVPWAIVAGAIGLLGAGGLVVALLTGGAPDVEEPPRVEPMAKVAPAEEPTASEPVVVPAARSSELAAPRPEPAAADQPDEPSAAVPAKSKNKRKVVAPTAAAKPDRESESVPSLAQERAMLQRARNALGAGEFERAESLIAQYDREIPEPMLGEERDVLEIRALCLGGARGVAEKRAKRFHANHPLSPHRATLLQACK